MLAQIINLLALSIPLILLPILLGTGITKHRLDLSTRWWLGFLLISLALIIFHALSIPPTVYSLLIIMIILVLLFWQREMLVLELLKTSKILTNPISWVWVIIALFIIVVGLVEIKTYPVISGDALSIWLNKAKSIYAGKSFWTLAIVQYPSLGPIFWTFAMRFTGGYEPIYGLYLGPIAYSFWILAHLSLFEQKNNWVIVAIIFSTAILFYDSTVYNGYQDKLVMMCAGMAVLTYVRYFLYSIDSSGWNFHNGRFDLFWLGTFLAGMLSFIKTEGAIMGLIIFSSTLFVVACSYPKGKRYEFFKTNYPPIIFFLALLSTWPLILYFGNVDLSKIQGDNFSLQSGFDFFKNLDRLPIIALRHLEYYHGIFPALTISILLTLLAFRSLPKIRIILSYVWLIWLAHLVFITLIFLVTRAPLIWHLDTAFNRLSSQHDFVYPLIISLIISCLLRKDHVPFIENSP